MVKFTIAGRRKPGESQELFFYNWGIIHVALMLTTPSVFRTMRRYAQHYSVKGISNDELRHPLSPMAWDSFADHWLEDFNQLISNVSHPAYRARMQPHSFADSSMLVEFNQGTTVYERPGFRSGGLKLIHYLKKRPELSQAEFVRGWLSDYGPALVEALCDGGGLRKYVQNPRLEFDSRVFADTLFARSQFGQYAGIEEIWLSSRADLGVLARTPKLVRREAELLAPEGSFSIVAMERVIYDGTHHTDKSPDPAVWQLGTLESIIDAQGYSDWNRIVGSNPGSDGNGFSTRAEPEY